jgi:hypothetical protein
MVDSTGVNHSTTEFATIKNGDVLTLTQGNRQASFTVTNASTTGSYRAFNGTWSGDLFTSFATDGTLVTLALSVTAPEGSVLTAASGQPAWKPLPAPPAAGAQYLFDLDDVSMSPGTAVGKVLGTTATGVWGPVNAPGGLPANPSDLPLLVWNPTTDAWEPARVTREGVLIMDSDVSEASRTASLEVEFSAIRARTEDASGSRNYAEIIINKDRIQLNTEDGTNGLYGEITASGVDLDTKVTVSSLIAATDPRDVPTAPVNGQMWRGADNKVYIRTNGQTVEVGAGGAVDPTLAADVDWLEGVVGKTVDVNAYPIYNVYEANQWHGNAPWLDLFQTNSNAAAPVTIVRNNAAKHEVIVRLANGRNVARGVSDFGLQIDPSGYGTGYIHSVYTSEAKTTRVTTNMVLDFIAAHPNEGVRISYHGTLNTDDPNAFCVMELGTPLTASSSSLAERVDALEDDLSYGISGSWNWGLTGTPSEAGQVRVNSASAVTEIRIMVTDLTGANREAEIMASVKAGTAITIASSNKTLVYSAIGAPQQRSGSPTNWLSIPVSTLSGVIGGTTAPAVNAPVTVTMGAAPGSVLTVTGQGLDWAAPSAAGGGGLDQAAADARYLQLSGGTLTGNLTLPNNPPTNAQAVRKDTMDTAISMAVGGYWKRWSGTKAQYDAIATKDQFTLYGITG